MVCFIVNFQIGGLLSHFSLKMPGNMALNFDYTLFKWNLPKCWGRLIFAILGTIRFSREIGTGRAYQPLSTFINFINPARRLHKTY
jgi:hypothetical protein